MVLLDLSRLAPVPSVDLLVVPLIKHPFLCHDIGATLTTLVLGDISWLDSALRNSTSL
jgi:hypothetical protein